jgi:hypothetical protein
MTPSRVGNSYVTARLYGRPSPPALSVGGLKGDHVSPRHVMGAVRSSMGPRRVDVFVSLPMPLRVGWDGVGLLVVVLIQKFLFTKGAAYEEHLFFTERRPSMDPRERERILELCREIDLLVAQDPGTSDLGVLERARAKMNDFINADDLHAAEEVMYGIMLLHAGLNADEYVVKYRLR